MKYFNSTLLITLLTLQVASASSNCDLINQISQPENTRMSVLTAMMDDLEMVRHSSIDTLSDFEMKEYFLNFLKDVCKIEDKHLALTQKRGVRFYLTNGPIIVHPEMAKLHARHEKPRNHATSLWADLPGAYQPTTKHVIINIASLNEGHGAKNLVLHEYGHALDYVFSNGFFGSNKLSSSREFKRATRDTPWLEIYRVKDHLDPEKYSEDKGFSKDGADRWRQSTLAYNKSLDENAQGVIEYAQANKEEHFAELFAMNYKDAQGKAKLERLLPQAAIYFSELSEPKSRRSRGSRRHRRSRSSDEIEQQVDTPQTHTSEASEDSGEKRPSGLRRFFRRVKKTVKDTVEDIL